MPFCGIQITYYRVARTCPLEPRAGSRPRRVKAQVGDPAIKFARPIA